MRIFLDTSDPLIVKEYQYFIDGVTTNPSLLSKSKAPIKQSIEQIGRMVIETVSVEAIADDYAGMLEEGKKILKYSSNVAIKLPITKDGLRACSHFAAKGVPVNMTLCFTASQALLAAKCGATYVSPFIGRLDDWGEDGMRLIRDIVEGFYVHNIETSILAASIRSTEHVEECFKAGADIATLPPKLIEEMLHHPLTDAGIAKFKQDWQGANLKL